MAFVPSFTHTYARAIARGGFVQQVPSPLNPASDQLASYNSAVLSTVVPIVFGATAYTVNLPAVFTGSTAPGAIIVEVAVADVVAFSAGATISIGSAVAGTDILAATSIVASSRNTPASPVVSTSTGNGQTVYLTIGGAPAAGSGFVAIMYVLPAVQVNGLLD
jgi:hypothetical protein